MACRRAKAFDFEPALIAVAALLAVVLFAFTLWQSSQGDSDLIGRQKQTVSASLDQEQMREAEELAQRIRLGENA